MPRASSSPTPRKTAKATPAKAPAPKVASPAKATKATKASSTTKATEAPEAAAPARAKAAAPVRAKKAPDRVTAAPESPRSTPGAPAADFHDEQRVLLLEERATYTRQAKDLRAEAEQLAEDREPGDVQFDEESGQGDSMNVERERDLALSAQAMAAIEDIDRALGRIDLGTYGVCERCGEPIPEERLKALPYASLCVKCKSGGLSRR